MVGFRGSSQEKWLSEIFRVDYGIIANHKMVPDPVGSGTLYQRIFFRRPFRVRFEQVISDHLQSHLFQPRASPIR